MLASALAVCGSSSSLSFSSVPGSFKDSFRSWVQSWAVRHYDTWSDEVPAEDESGCRNATTHGILDFQPLEGYDLVNELPSATGRSYLTQQQRERRSEKGNLKV